MRLRKERRHVSQQASFPGYAGVVAIASGPFAAVYRATELGTSRPVALKVLRLEDASQASLEPLNEHLETLSLLGKHPNVVTLYRTFFTPEGLPVLVTEFCRESLAQRLSRSGPLPPATVLPLAIKVAGAVESAHKAGLVHGDVKPENILISGVGEPLLGDFGLAALQPAAESTESLAGETTLHAAPEAFEDVALTPAADVYGLASSMYQLLLGRGPFVTFPGEAPASVILRVLRDPPPRPPLGSMPIALADLIEAALAKDPGRRPRSAAVLAESLRAIEGAAGWPRTPYVVWGISELTGARPALRPAGGRGALEAGDGDGDEGEDEMSDGVENGVVGEAPAFPGGDAGDVSGFRQAAGSGTQESSPAAGSPTVIETTWRPAGAGRATAARRDGADEGDVHAGELEGGDVEGDEAEAAGEVPAADEAPAPEHVAGAGGATATVEAASDAAGRPEGAESGNDGPPPAPARRVITPPAVERTVVVPEPLPRRPPDTSQPAHAIQSYRRSSGIPRPAG